VFHNNFFFGRPALSGTKINVTNLTTPMKMTLTVEAWQST
jgi:uncharacterized protein (DUF433 family)